MQKTTESASPYRHLEKMSVHDLLTGINNEDAKVAESVKASLPEIKRLLEALIPLMKEGGRLFYIGAGTSGRLGILDASECPPTFGVSHDLIIGIIAGGDSAIRKAVEFAEDDTELAWKTLQEYQIDQKDFVIGIAASGTTPYVLGGLEKCKKHGIQTGCITCNVSSPISEMANYPIEVKVGPEFLTGSTRMKSGTAQKMVLNMISTVAMIQLGRVVDNKMVDMQLTNNKLIDRGINMILAQKNISYSEAKRILLKHGSVREAIQSLENRNHSDF
ncbi:MAG: N-acetylmuramic acid 6-phosphate etherase [Saprospiraceae bacterium]|jgi:N-acetylmuramic acid 6-phosphate etherase|nr:N-acetylmuramic acid 6-phosphate etherase [Saprospiraceae bacterium]